MLRKLLNINSKSNLCSFSTMTSTSQQQQWCVYALQSISTNKSYVGASTNFSRRIRQHNSEIKGGAKYTRCAKDWKCIYRVNGFVDTDALKFEWWLKHSGKVSGKRKRRFIRSAGRGVNGRITNLQRVFHLEKWQDVPLTVTWCDGQRPSSFVAPPWIVEKLEDKVDEDEEDDKEKVNEHELDNASSNSTIDLTIDATTIDLTIEVN
tara:strand:- start:884 stop:1504 length:621 start_codon:yes stop_codon:yes gene_type:complete